MTATYASPRMARSKSGADILVDKMKVQQLKSDENRAIEFLNTMLDCNINGCDLHQELKDGVLLCNLVNKLKPGTIKHVGQKDLSFVKMDNITRFLQGARQLGLKDTQLFETIDLFEGKDMAAVVHTILALAQLSAKQDSSDNQNEEVTEGQEDKPIIGREKLQNIDTDVGKETGDKGTKAGQTASFNSQSSEEDWTDKAQRYRHVRDIFSFHGQVSTSSLQLNKDALASSHSLQLNPNQLPFDNDHRASRSSLPSSPTTPGFVRPPKSPLRPMSKPSSHQQHRSLRIRSSAEDLRSHRRRRPSAPSFSTQNNSDSFKSSGLSSGFSVAMSRTSSASSCSSMLSSVSSSSSAPKTPITPSSLRHAPTEHGIEPKAGANASKQSRRRRQSVSSHRSKDKTSLPSESSDRNSSNTGSLGHKLDQQLAKTVEEITNEEKSREKLLLKSKDGSTSTQYQLGNCIGKGQFGSVYRALDLATGEIVAVKRVKLEEGELDQEIMVVHCDLKAANILTTKTGDVKLTDFGVSLNLKIKGADAGTVSGTPNWMAPEVIELQGASTKSDIWSLGCTLVELVTGKPPYSDLIAMSAMFRIVEDDYPPLPENISEEMHSFLLCCFQKNPDDRPTATQLKEHNWIRKNQRKLKKTETYSHSLTSYLSHKQQQMRPSSLRSSRDITSSCHPLDEVGKNETQAATDSDSFQRTESQFTQLDDDENATNTIPDFIAPEDEDYITHHFIQTSFGKAVECKVCGDLIKSQTIFCEVCALVCHKDCKRMAFSCPPKVNDQQLSYDIYNRGRQERYGSHDSVLRTVHESPLNRRHRSVDALSLKNHPQAENIRKYSQALGLTPQEQRALSENQALLSHTLALHKMNPEAVEKMRRRTKDGKKPFNEGEECVIA
ncbi:hypothetical protein EC973_000135 [Apophysomyces ossiformis]|uniref:non-specific serine/threonine protein kinase n=1 Tax=Apophysomyces ossiformis TaxID=679940 RepID=A0A8H7BZV8_9FUNG|nr:hypothetical protein EC973_000135 [Apophysomyces ossiformis]